MDPTARRIPLVLRLAAVLGIAGVVLAALLAFWLEPRTARALNAHGQDLLREGGTAMHELAHEHSANSGDLLADLLRGAATDRERALELLPLEHHAGDAAAVRAAIRDDDARRSAHQQQTVQEKTDALQQRIEASIATRLRALASSQAARTAAFVDDLHTTDLLLVACTLGVLLLALGFAVHRLVVVPVQRLAAAARAVAGGDLAAAPTAAGQDEIGALTRDFTGMVTQLRAARSAHEALTASLATQVAERTRHLEHTLAELANSHRQLAQAERLTALGTLAGGIAHEFHNVIGGIRGCAADLAADETEPDRKETLAVITRAADRASGIVRQLQRFARNSVEQSREFDLAAVVGDALLLCEPAARRQSVQVQRDLPGTVVVGDADGLHQVCVNLLVNALQAMPDGGKLGLALTTTGDEVRLAIADTGCGIADEHLPHVFEPFFTTRGSDPDPARRGTGLGLSVSWGIVHAHGGRIDVRSQRGAGTTFTVVLPRPGASAH
ncbi:MAG: HAMP domain-containing protein [Planctomycetes bacterium]|nr:HAMP domain-containing protein [Planctomycetota bacterium]